jgi:hypothetical protein
MRDQQRNSHQRNHEGRCDRPQAPFTQIKDYAAQYVHRIGVATAGAAGDAVEPGTDAVREGEGPADGG